MNKTLCLLLLLLCGLAVSASTARADSIDTSVAGTGTTEIKKRPETMRMVVDMRVEGKDLKDALAKLKTARERIKPELIKLGATETTIDFGSPRTFDAGRDDRQAMMERAIRLQMSRNGGKGEAATAPVAAKPITISVSIKAEWPLGKNADDEQLLLTTSDLQNKVREAKLFAQPKPEAAKTEEEEENAAPSQTNYDPEQVVPGEPVFIFVAKITAEDRAKAAVESFKKAKDDALATAKAAGVELGALKQVASQAFPAGDMPQDFGDNPYYGGYRGSFAARSIFAGSPGGDPEALAREPGPVTTQVTIAAKFAIK